MSRVKDCSLSSLLGFMVLLAASLGACEGCHRSAPPRGDAPETAKPTLRIIALSGLGGALEPCGCSKGQHGGLDHLGALLEARAPEAPHRALVAAGSTFFTDIGLDAQKAEQHRWKAETTADALRQLGVAALSPGFNDWIAGSKDLQMLAERTGAPLLAANLEGFAGVRSIDIGGTKVAFIGLSDPKSLAGQLPEGVVQTPLEDSLRAAVSKATADGSRLLIGVASMDRGAALRMLERVDGLHVLVLSRAREMGDANTKTRGLDTVNSTPVVELANHGQSVGFIDIYDRGESPIALSKDRNPGGSYFTYEAIDVHEELGKAPAVASQLETYFQRVNERNKVAFAGRKAPVATAGIASYVGVQVCGSCHVEEKAFWEATPHARAYPTLEKQHKQFNLDCVSCHVTGYERPGGSTVTDNDALQSVQCEECHGPGSRHIAEPSNPAFIDAAGGTNRCASACHHPPHVDDFDVAIARTRIVGPGHGMPKAPGNSP